MTTKSLSDLSLDASVKVKPGVKDPDTGDDIGGWQGRITDFGEDEGQRTVCIAWDSHTLKSMPEKAVTHAIREGVDWQSMFLLETEIEVAAPRDTPAEVEEVIDEIENRTVWLHLDDEGRIQSILTGVDAEDTTALLIAWEQYLDKHLRFPFEAEVVELLERGRLRIGDRLQVTELSDSNDHHGLLVGGRRGQERFVFPLCDLEATDKKSPNYQPINDYVVWFANR